jgi:hypothetical protein
VNTRVCKRCGAVTWSSRSPYCLAHRPPPEVRAQWAAKSRERRGYGAAHKRLRETYRRAIEGGKVVLCARCRRRILPGTPFDLGHTDDRSGWTGPEHRMCNQLAGARKGAAVSNARLTTHPSAKRRWSRNWNAPMPPPPDVIVLGAHL